MNLSEDLMLIPSRAFLTDQLPESQLEFGNSFYGGMQALGGVTGLALTLVPFEDVPPLSMLGSHLCACLAVIAVICLATLALCMTVNDPRVSKSSSSRSAGDEEMEVGGGGGGGGGAAREQSRYARTEDSPGNESELRAMLTRDQLRNFDTPSRRKDREDTDTEAARYYTQVEPLTSGGEDVYTHTGAYGHAHNTHGVYAEGDEDGNVEDEGEAVMFASSAPVYQLRHSVLQPAATVPAKPCLQPPEFVPSCAADANAEAAAVSVARSPEHDSAKETSNTGESEPLWTDVIQSLRVLPSNAFRLWVMQFFWWGCALNLCLWW